MDIATLEIEGRLKYFGIDRDTYMEGVNKRPSASDFTSRIDFKLELILCHELKGGDYDGKVDFNYMRDKAVAFLDIAERLRPQFVNCLELLAYFCFTGKDETFQFFVDSMNVISKYEKEHASIRDYQYYKCLCAIWGGDMDIAMEIIEKNALQKGNKKFYLPSSEGAVRAMLEKNEPLFIELIEKMREEHAKKHKNIRFLNQSFARGVVACPAMALLKVSEKYFGKEIACKISSKQHTFKFLPRFIEGVDLEARGEFTIDHMFPLKFWPCNQPK